MAGFTTKKAVQEIIHALHQVGNCRDTVKEILFTIYTGTSYAVHAGIETMLDEEYGTVPTLQIPKSLCSGGNEVLPNTYCVEASTAGFPPGLWPGEVLLEGVGILKKAEQKVHGSELFGVYYRCHPVSLLVLND